MTANQMGATFEQLYEATTGKKRNFTNRETSLFINLGIKEFVDRRMFPDGNIKQKGFEADAKRVAELSPLLATSADIYFKQNHDFVRGTYMNGAVRNSDKDLEGITPVNGEYGDVTDAEDAKYGVLIELNDNILFILSEQCDLTFRTSGERRYNVKTQQMSKELYNDYVYNELKNPGTDLVWRIEYGQSLPASVVETRPNPEFRSSNSSRTTPVAVNSRWYFNGERKRIIQLLPGKGWDVEKYNLQYLREPRLVVVDYVDPTKQVHCDLNGHFHYDVVQAAVRIAVASIIPPEQKYQVIDNEVNRLE